MLFFKDLLKDLTAIGKTYGWGWSCHCPLITMWRKSKWILITSVQVSALPQLKPLSTRLNMIFLTDSGL